MACLYFIGNQKLKRCKVGISSDNDPKKRIAAIQTSFPEKLEIFAIVTISSESLARTIENKIHRFMDGYRTSGEWFLIDGLFECALDDIKRDFEGSTYGIIPQMVTGIFGAIIRNKKLPVKDLVEANNKKVEILSSCLVMACKKLSRIRVAHELQRKQFETHFEFLDGEFSYNGLDSDRDGPLMHERINEAICTSFHNLTIDEIEDWIPQASDIRKELDCE